MDEHDPLVQGGPGFAYQELLRAKVTPGRIRGRAWLRKSYGLYLPVTLPGAYDPFDAAVRLVAKALPPGAGFGHLTGARIRGWWLPNQLGDLPAGLLMASTDNKVHYQRDGLYVRRSDYCRTQQVAGVPVVVVEELLLELARDLTLVDLVPMVDQALRDGATADGIRAAARPRSKGAPTLRRAVAFADQRSESWWESVLRLMHVVTGLGPVDCQVEVHDGRNFVARADLHLVGTNRFPECDGGEHRTRERHQVDLRRDKAMSRLGLERFGYTPAEITHQPALILHDAESARGLPHDERRVAAWRRLAASSTLTSAGRARLRRRLEAYHRSSLR